MKKSLHRILNEGFEKKYFKEDYDTKLENEIKNVLKNAGYDITIEGADNYISAAAEYIDMAREYDGVYSVEEWLEDTEMNYPEDLLFMRAEVKEESLKEDIVANAKNWLIDKEGKTPKEAENIINTISPEDIEKIALNYVKKGKLKENFSYGEKDGLFVIYQDGKEYQTFPSKESAEDAGWILNPSDSIIFNFDDGNIVPKDSFEFDGLYFEYDGNANPNPDYDCYYFNVVTIDTGRRNSFSGRLSVYIKDDIRYPYKEEDNERTVVSYGYNNEKNSFYTIDTYTYLKDPKEHDSIAISKFYDKLRGKNESLKESKQYPTGENIYYNIELEGKDEYDTTIYNEYDSYEDAYADMLDLIKEFKKKSSKYRSITLNMETVQDDGLTDEQWLKYIKYDDKKYGWKVFYDLPSVNHVIYVLHNIMDWKRDWTDYNTFRSIKQIAYACEEYDDSYYAEEYEQVIKNYNLLSKVTKNSRYRWNESLKESISEEKLYKDAEDIADRISEFLDRTSQIKDLYNYMDDYDLEYVGKTMDILYDFSRLYAINEKNNTNESLNDLTEAYDTDIVAEILSGVIPQPKSLKVFRWLSSNGESGEVRYRGVDYAFRKKPDGTYKVMRSSDAGWNWSETLYKEDLEQDTYNKFKSDIYNAIGDVCFKYNWQGLSQSDIEKAIEWFTIHFFDDFSDEDYFEESLNEDIVKKEVFHNDNGTDYDIVERSVSGRHALLNKGPKWIIAWNCPENNEGSWGQGHYFFREEDARKVWEDKYLNENYRMNLKRKRK